MRYIAGYIAGTFAVGVGLGVWIGRSMVESKLRAEYEASQKAFERSLKLSVKMETEEPVAEEFHLETLPLDEQSNVFTGPIEVVEGEAVSTNDYLKAMAATETDVDLFVSGGVNDYGISYIEEEEYQEEDGRFKGRIDIMMDDMNPIFLMDGVQIDDWDKRLGDSILVDFYKLVPPGLDPVLYVRNHKAEEDYEVVRVLP